MKDKSKKWNFIPTFLLLCREFSFYFEITLGILDFMRKLSRNSRIYFEITLSKIFKKVFR